MTLLWFAMIRRYSSRRQQLGNALRTILVISIACILGSHAAVAQTVELEPGMPYPGTPFGNLSGAVNVILPLEDGSIVVGGEQSFTLVGTNTKVGALVRLLPDGTRDPVFGAWLPVDSSIHVIHRLPSGRFFVGGSQVNGNTGVVSGRVWRLAEDGGRVTEGNFYGVTDWQVRSLAVQDDGRVVIAGGGGNFPPKIARLSSIGSLESGFSVDLGANGTAVSKVRFLPDGKILLAGDFPSVAGNTNAGKFARLNADGSLDATFIASIPQDQTVLIPAVCANGTILLGKSGNSSLDLRGDRGTLVSVPASAPDGEVSSIVVQEDGKYLIGGSFATVSGQSTRGVVRLNADGTLDAGFNSLWDSDTRTISIAPDGSIYAGGSGVSPGGGTAPPALVRLKNTEVTSFAGLSGGNLLQWYRAPTAPLASRVLVEMHAHGSMTWTSLGYATRTFAGYWQLPIFSLPPSAELRGIVQLTMDDVTTTTTEDILTVGVPSPRFFLRARGAGEILSGQSLSFPAVGFTGSSQSLQFDLENPGTADLENITWSITGPAAGDFSFASDLPVALGKVGAIALPDLVFRPQGDGARTATLTITSNDPDRPMITVGLAGVGSDTFSPHFSSPGDVYAAGTSFDASNIALGTVTLDFIPVPGQTLSAFRSDSGTPVSGRFVGPANGERVTATHMGNTYEYLVQYHPDGHIYLRLIYKGMPDYNFIAKSAGSESSGVGPWRHFMSAGNGRANFLRLDGFLDPTMPPISNSWEPALVCVQDDGKFYTLHEQQFTRWNADGTMDTSFQRVSRYPSRLIQLRDKRIVMTSAIASLGQHLQFFLENGDPDPSVAPIPWDSYTNAIAQQPDGKILVAGGVSGIRRLELNGVEDTSFVFTTGSVEAGKSSVVSAILPLPGGKILVGGHFTVANEDTNRRHLVLLNADGTTDTDFNPRLDGIVTTLMKLNDGRLFVGGDFNNVVEDRVSRIRRGFASFLPNGKLDEEYNLMASFSTGVKKVRAINMLWDGSILLSGSLRFSLYQEKTYGLARIINTPLTSTVTVNPGTSIRWTRNAEAADLQYATFEYRGDGESAWTQLGDGVRDGEGTWVLYHTAALPTSGLIRVKGRLLTSNRSSAVVQESHPFGRSQLTPLEQWREDHFADASGEGPAANHLDADGDGLRNLIEYGLGLHPKSMDSQAAVPVWNPVPGAHEVTFTPQPGLSLEYGAEWSTTLRDDDWHPAVEVPGDPSQKTFRVPHDAPGVMADQLFFRLRFSE